MKSEGGYTKLCPTPGYPLAVYRSQRRVSACELSGSPAMLLMTQLLSESLPGTPLRKGC